MYFLMPPLHAAIPLKKVDCIAMHVCKYLDLYVAWPLDEALQQHSVITKGCSCLSLC